MKVEYRIFGSVALFLLLAAIVYGWWTVYEFGEIEWIGTVALLLSFFLTGMCSWYFWIVSRRISLRPEDRPDAEMSEGAGVVGFFSPGSYWPVGMAAAASLLGLGLAFWLWWMIIGGLVALAFTTAGLVLEYFTGTRRIAEH